MLTSSGISSGRSRNGGSWIGKHSADSRDRYGISRRSATIFQIAVSRGDQPHRRFGIGFIAARDVQTLAPEGRAAARAVARTSVAHSSRNSELYPPASKRSTAARWRRCKRAALMTKQIAFQQPPPASRRSSSTILFATSAQVVNGAGNQLYRPRFAQNQYGTSSPCATISTCFSTPYIASLRPDDPPNSLSTLLLPVSAVFRRPCVPSVGGFP